MRFIAKNSTKPTIYKPFLLRYKLVNMRNVTVTKGPDECFGFVIHSSLRAEDTFKIGQVVADSPAGRCADLMKGDSVLTVNGKIVILRFVRSMLLDFSFSFYDNLHNTSVLTTT